MASAVWQLLFGTRSRGGDDALERARLRAARSDPPARETPAATDLDAALDAALVARIRGGDTAAFRELYLASVISLIGVARNILHDASEAEDVVQDVFVSVWNRRAEFQPARTMAYLVGAVRKHALDRVRHLQIVHRVAHEEHDLPPAMSAALAAPDDLAARAELSAALGQVVAQLPERRRTALLLRILHGMSYSEIAAVLGVGETAAHMLVTRTLAALRPHLARFLER
jgi:RNA polymerase sigma-70 factor (ECF subfamily)